ncbi:uncharacterized protein TRIADDRAFT_59748 [Trichoplax adhaerens]|uniref:Uncharacterized protein n=1 Tax=Trichoplax adhaerens TaxID=10228 RepID=B3S6B7_TRIAD|nr:predicted protein [Trichoplax adhaerens]EDV21729.1 predicted protein [Trichoplax adhaerens]|eukprot:XP_002115877.1 predicted protein [Trichoplax adhaerens]
MNLKYLYQEYIQFCYIGKVEEAIGSNCCYSRVFQIANKGENKFLHKTQDTLQTFNSVSFKRLMQTHRYIFIKLLNKYTHNTRAPATISDPVGIWVIFGPVQEIVWELGHEHWAKAILTARRSSLYSLRINCYFFIGNRLSDDLIAL